MVIPHRHQHTTRRRRSCHIGVTHHISRTIHAGAFAVPQTKYTIVLALAAQFSLLRPPMRRCG